MFFIFLTLLESKDSLISSGVSKISSMFFKYKDGPRLLKGRPLCQAFLQIQHWHSARGVGKNPPEPKICIYI